MNKEEMVKLFDLNNISKASATFDFNKMLWIAKEHIQKLSDDDYLCFVKPFISVDIKSFEQKINDILLLFKPQISFAIQLNDLITDIFLSPKSDKNIDSILLQYFTQEIKQTNEITPQIAQQIIKNVQNQTKLSGKKLYMPLRMLLTGKEHGPELYKIIDILGKNKILNIIDRSTNQM
jgi:glutamyl/glutaminyl-tRNA synthetase